MSYEWMFPPTHERDKLLEVQLRVAELVRLKDDFGSIRLIGGVDQAFIDNKVISGAVVLDYDSQTMVETTHQVETVDFPYIPGFLSFREGPSIVKAIQKLNRRPEVLMVDGAGYNHPRRAGLATHVGVALDIPTVGVAKKILVGTATPPTNVGEATELIHDGELVGYLLLSKKGTRPIVVAPGHRVSPDSALEIVRHCIRGYKLPEPTRLADRFVAEVKRSITS